MTSSCRACGCCAVLHHCCAVKKYRPTPLEDIRYLWHFLCFCPSGQAVGRLGGRAGGRRNAPAVQSSELS